MNRIKPIWNGRVAYPQGLELMAEAEARARAGEYSLLGFEFEPVVTLGVRGRADQDLLWSTAELEARGVEFQRVDRGGEATLHSPGQLVIYPVVDIRALEIGPRHFVERIEATTRELLGDCGIPSFKGACESGVFTERGKIAFVGLRIRQGIVTHGLAINVSNDLGLFSAIRSCGQARRSHDRMLEWQANPVISEVYNAWCERFTSSLPLTTGARHGLSSAPIGGL